MLLNSTGRCFCARITGPLVFAVFPSMLSIHFGCYGSAGAYTNWEVPLPPISWKMLCPTGAKFFKCLVEFCSVILWAWTLQFGVFLF